ncbi:MAG: GNAT family N-acetyltransferase [Candidatus Rokuibacteriota bacterium]|nr:MAG: GNAT family N-acetyltransferase [Candidatus Rokubacteria bacterium]
MAVLELERPLRVTEVTDRGAFEALAHEWDALVAATDDQIFYRHEFVRTWIAHFAPTAPLRVLLARDATGGLAAVLPLVEQRTSLLGAPLIELRSTANAHSCRFDLLAADADLAGRAFFAHLAEDRRWDVLRIGEVPEGGRAWTLAAAAAARGYPVASTSVDSPYVPLRPSWPEQSATLPAKFRANCRRRRRKLEATGAVTFDPCPGGDELDAYLEAGFELEARGWKGSRGTAMAQSQSTRGFYTELARAAWRGKYLRLYFLRVDGRPVAFQYGLCWNGRYLLLKPAYDESLAECSPGQLLVEDVLKDCISHGLREFDFLGADMPWKRDWTDHARQHSALWIFRNSAVGRALAAARFRWMPAARRLVQQWRTARP